MKNVADLPLNKLLGMQVRDGGERPSIALLPGEQHLNHVGTVHAAVLFALAEAASGQYLLSRHPFLVENHVVVLRSTSAKYRNPARGGREIVASYRPSDDSVDVVKFTERLRTRGRAIVDLEVTVVQDDVQILDGTFRWFATTKENG